ncbi:hypothetical protein FHR83_006712 [Actinoplanes campanulatus]|uniref:Uncharacterized protein n=1 Tax=Actinoplanes campanulatus TaxID=113559 RepID=A0A7W5AMU8_9ACTN|nr:hypothetical protein [Actinoplanes campanulatus]MBB3099006.1 hypothetical protein [Actinoplanes campanulatus]GGN39481.1 hypothetical protein GCM10010109_67440 [Actinoplanes campanulatus]GID40166.1 hypothetical protein Aca09nite_66720 [Actinoplanes campanulatus]
MASVRVTFRPNSRGVRQAGSSNAIYRELERRANKVITLAQQIAAPHRDTGEYHNSFRTERTRIRGMAAVQVVNDSDHAVILENGSRPHVIEPKNKKALAWPGARHPVRRVNHPGTPALHVLRRALRAAGR